MRNKGFTVYILGIVVVVFLLKKLWITHQPSFLLTVIIPIYQTKRYLNESIHSVIIQTLNFQQHIQLILVNDGSTDGSEQICLLYAHMYPNNIVYLYQENQGVSSARNRGLRDAKGKYVTFLDSDDKWESTALQKMINYFEEHYEDINILSARMQSFEERTSFLDLDRNFNETSIRNVLRDYTFIQQFITPCLLKTSAIRNLQFPENVRVGEDSHFICQLLLQHPFMGFFREAIYFYRRRKNHTSQTQIASKGQSWYFDTPAYCYNAIIVQSQEVYGYVPAFIQYYVMFDIGYRMGIPQNGYLAPLDYQRYCSIISTIIQQIDDKIILEVSNMDIWKKLECLSKKRQEDVRKELTVRGRIVYYKQREVMKFDDSSTLEWTRIKTVEDTIEFHANDHCGLMDDQYSYFLLYKDELHEALYTEYTPLDRISMFGTYKKGRKCIFTLPLSQLERGVLRVYFYYRSQYYELFIPYQQLLRINGNPYEIDLDGHHLAIRDNRLEIVS